METWAFKMCLLMYERTLRSVLVPREVYDTRDGVPHFLGRMVVEGKDGVGPEGRDSVGTPVTARSREDLRY